METAQEVLLMQLRQCAALLQSDRFQPAGQDGGLGRLLFLLNKMDNANQTDLVNILDSRPGSVSELIDRLERLEQVDRRRNGNDRRKVNLFLAQKEKKTLQEAENSRKFPLSDVFACFDEGEVNQFSLLLAKLLARLEAMNAVSASGNEKREKARANRRDQDVRKSNA